MPFKTFTQWLFDGKKNNDLPKEKRDKDGKLIVPDILSYKSPVTSTFIISLFLRNGPLNHYLNKYLNNENLYYLSKEDLLIFVKRAVQELKVQKRDIMFYYRTKKDELVEILSLKFPFLKYDDVFLLSEKILAHENRDSILESLGLSKDKPKKTKTKKSKDKVKPKTNHVEKSGIPLREFLRNFEVKGNL